ncbi:MAG: glycosyltransferase family 4 protein [Gammaproteobacteria bacterium]|nr:glycosyltransferase family 4 protein [Gammaproteobacteria bacterium]MDH3535427.1 glycosyltransferase family 4 protein [Gammaproteobacteria bacterium]
MKIAFTHPYCWPFMRRGNERNIDVMARYFTRQGHEVTTISSRPGRYGIEHDDSGTRILARPIEIPGMSLLRINTMHTFWLTAWRELQRHQFDVVHSLLFTDALAATMRAPGRGFATVFQMNGVALPGLSCRRFPPEAAMYRRVMKSADALITCSEYIRALVQEHYGVDSIVIPPMVDVDTFASGSSRAAERPYLLAAGDFTVPRKGIRVLLEAFPLVKREYPELVLRLSGCMPEQLIAPLIRTMPEKIRGDIELLGLGRPDDLPTLYSESSVLVLPAMGEPSGTVLMEAWAAGTPIVTTNHGGVPEFVTPEVGIMFEPMTGDLETRNAEGLAEAIVKAMQLAQNPATADACRAHAQDFSGARIGMQIEALYDRIR